jgi:hypothetical protein
MTWTFKAILGLVAILALWCAGWVVLVLLLLGLDRHWPTSRPDSGPLRVISIVAPALTYFLAGPAGCLFYIRWIGKLSGKEHEQRTRERIAKQRLAKKLERGAPADRSR